ncbi:MAG: hypothetical protein HWN65_20895 [Candidatus Helarchaeota archaeon]|nr:hypothetical protein [Candidatus Helarchaeota archaeon]
MKRNNLKLILLLFSILLFNSFIYFVRNKSSLKYQNTENSENFLVELEISEWNHTTIEVISTESNETSSNPAIAVDVAGHVHVVWDDEKDYGGAGPDVDIFYKCWNATTGIWTSAEVISTESTDDTLDPTIAIDWAGNLHVAWGDRTDTGGAGPDRDIFYKRRSATTGTWTSAELVSTESNFRSTNPMIAVDDAGNVHVAWYDSTNYSGAGPDVDIFYKCWNATTGNWTMTEVLFIESTTDSYHPTIAVDESGNVYVAWDDETDYGGAESDMDIFYKCWNATTGNWTTTELVSTESDAFSSFPSIGVDEVGNVHIAWDDLTNYSGAGIDLDLFYKCWNVTTGSWTLTEVVSTESTDNSIWSTSVVDGAGNMHVAWYDPTNYSGAGTDDDIFYKRRNALTGSWSKTEVISTNCTENSRNPSIMVDGFGYMHILWEDLTNYSNAGSDWDIFYRKAVIIIQDLVWKKMMSYNVTSWDNGDINGDGIPEIVAFSRECPMFWVLNSSDGSTLWSKNFSALFGDLPWAGPSGVTSEEMKVGDITGDSIAEIIVPSSTSTHKLLYAFNGSGALLWTYAHAGAGKFESVALGDINGDQINDIAARSPDGDQAHVLANNGTFLWTSPFLGGWGRSMHVKNLYDNPYDNKIITSGSPDIYVFNDDFSTNWTASYAGVMGGDELGMGFGDVDGDGMLEIAVQVCPQLAVAGDSFIRIYEESGSEKWTFNYPAVYGLIYPDSAERPILLDVDDDNQDEILDLVVNHDDFSKIALLLFHGENSSFIWSYNFSQSGIAAHNVGNVLGDMDQEIIVQINDTLFIFDLSGQMLQEFCYNGSYILGEPLPPRPLICDFDRDGYEEVCATNNGTIALVKFGEDKSKPTIRVKTAAGNYYNTAPAMDVDFIDTISLDGGYYKVDSYIPTGINTSDWSEIFTDHASNTYTTNFMMDSSVWNALSNGSHVVYFKAWDGAKNIFDGPFYSWQFYKDITLPQVSNPRPGNFNYTNDITPTIRVDLTDSLSGINASSIVLSVEGVVRSHSWDGTTVNWDATPFLGGQEVNVDLNGSDNAGNAIPTFSWSFTIDNTPPTGFNVISPVNITHDKNPEVICRVYIDGAGINLSSAQHAYSTNGSLTPTNWILVDGVFLDSACLIPASDGATGYLYLKVNAVPFNQYSLTNNTIRFRVSDIAGNSETQLTAAIIQTAEEEPSNFITILIIIIAIVAGVASTTFIVLRRRRAVQTAEFAKMKQAPEKIRKQLLSAFKFSEELIQLFKQCELDSTVNEVLSSIQAISKRIQRDLPMLSIDLGYWSAELEQYIDPDATLTGQSALNLKYETNLYLEKISALIQSNISMYKSTFPEDVKTISSFEEKNQNLSMMMNDLEKKYSQRILIFLLVIDENSGVAIFQHNFAEKSVDPDLISGFLSAIQSFGSELTTEAAAMKKLAYKNFEIEMHVGRYVRVALVLSGSITKHLKENLAKFTDSFERTFEEHLKTWRGDVTKFEDATQLAFLYFIAETEAEKPDKAPAPTPKVSVEADRAEKEMEKKLREERDNFIADADEAIRGGNFNEAITLLEEAAELSEKMGDKEKASEITQRVNDIRTKLEKLWV